MGRNGNAVPDMGGGHMSESLYDFCRKYDRQYLLEEWDSEKNLPLMPDGVTHGSHTFLTNPPRKVVASRREFRRLSRGIFPRIPLDSKIRVQRCKVIALSQFFTGTVRTTASGGAGIDQRLPGMAASAPPPGHGVTAVGHPIRCQREIFLTVPFLQ